MGHALITISLFPVLKKEAGVEKGAVVSRWLRVSELELQTEPSNFKAVCAVLGLEVPSIQKDGPKPQTEKAFILSSPEPGCRAFHAAQPLSRLQQPTRKNKEDKSGKPAPTPRARKRRKFMP